jgi:hypothetical protein
LRRKIGPIDAFPDGQVDGSGGARRERDGDDLAALAQHSQRAVAALGAQRFDIRAERFTDLQPVQDQQAHQCMLDRFADTGRDQQPADLVAVGRGGV